MEQFKESICWICLIIVSVFAIWVFVTSVITTYESFVSDITKDLNQQLPPEWN